YGYHRELHSFPTRRSSDLLAKVYLTMGDYANARSYAEKVIDEGTFGLLDNYGDLFRPQNNNNKESIFAIQWIGCSEWGYGSTIRSEEHTSELQSRENLVCR